MLQPGFAWFAAAAFAASLAYFMYAYLFLFGPRPGSPQPGALTWNVGLFSVFALHHSVFARSKAKVWVKAIVPASLERAVYTLVASLLFAVVCWAWRPVDGLAWSLPGSWRWAGYAAQAAGVVLTIVGARTLDVLDLAGVRQATNAVAGPVRLKSDGLYGLVRHPLYFAWMLVVFGAPEMSMTRLTFALVSTLYLALAIPFEERGLIETFGPDYASYRKKVRWRMIPGVY
ncbi:MAG TPA: isoprenylcysteine carboxylmethyltransferase family protein [Vicinamibacterales bacterium]|nr:isoprenylcysteine carboxylmethyltransferase family protein [Vicinamibacterales bacterium]